MADHPRALAEIIADMDPAEFARLKALRAADGHLLPDINDGKPWSEMDVADLKSSVAHRSSLEETATLLCRSGALFEVACKAGELGLKWQLRSPRQK